MKRRDAVLALLALGAGPLAAEAQQAAKRARIGYLTPTNPDSAKIFLVPFVQGMRELGYVEGKDFVMEVRHAEGNVDRLPALAAELVRLRPDVIIAVYAPAIRALQKATTDIPIVASAGDPISMGFAKSLARPGGNITGLSTQLGDYNVKGLEMLAGVVPGLSRVALFDEPSNKNVSKLLEETAGAKGIALVRAEVRAMEELENAFSIVTRKKVEAAIMILGAVMFPNRRHIAELAIKNRLPSIAIVGDYAEAGGLMGYGINNADQFRRIALHVDKILKGAKPSDLPIEQPVKFELVINLKTAKVLGLKVPQSLLIRADRVIE